MAFGFRAFRGGGGAWGFCAGFGLLGVGIKVQHIAPRTQGVGSNLCRVFSRDSANLRLLNLSDERWAEALQQVLELEEF